MNMPNSTSSRVLRAALFTLVPLAYLSMPYWHPYWIESFPDYSAPPEWALASLKASVFLVSFLSWHLPDSCCLGFSNLFSVVFCIPVTGGVVVSINVLLFGCRMRSGGAD
jgi:hypothetical protein